MMTDPVPHLQQQPLVRQYSSRREKLVPTNSSHSVSSGDPLLQGLPPRSQSFRRSKRKDFSKPAPSSLLAREECGVFDNNSSDDDDTAALLLPTKTHRRSSNNSNTSGHSGGSGGSSTSGVTRSSSSRKVILSVVDNGAASSSNNKSSSSRNKGLSQSMHNPRSTHRSKSDDGSSLMTLSTTATSSSSNSSSKRKNSTGSSGSSLSSSSSAHTLPTDSSTVPIALIRKTPSSGDNTKHTQQPPQQEQPLGNNHSDHTPETLSINRRASNTTSTTSRAKSEDLTDFAKSAAVARLDRRRPPAPSASSSSTDTKNATFPLVNADGTAAASTKAAALEDTLQAAERALAKFQLATAKLDQGCRPSHRSSSMTDLASTFRASGASVTASGTRVRRRGSLDDTDLQQEIQQEYSRNQRQALRRMSGWGLDDTDLVQLQQEERKKEQETINASSSKKKKDTSSPSTKKSDRKSRKSKKSSSTTSAPTTTTATSGEQQRHRSRMRRRESMDDTDLQCEVQENIHRHNQQVLKAEGWTSMDEIDLQKLQKQQREDQEAAVERQYEPIVLISKSSKSKSSSGSSSNNKDTSTKSSSQRLERKSSHSKDKSSSKKSSRKTSTTTTATTTTTVRHRSALRGRGSMDDTDLQCEVQVNKHRTQQDALRSSGGWNLDDSDLQKLQKIRAEAAAQDVTGLPRTAAELRASSQLRGSADVGLRPPSQVRATQELTVVSPTNASGGGTRYSSSTRHRSALRGRETMDDTDLQQELQVNIHRSQQDALRTSRGWNLDDSDLQKLQQQREEAAREQEKKKSSKRRSHRRPAPEDGYKKSSKSSSRRKLPSRSKSLDESHFEQEMIAKQQRFLEQQRLQQQQQESMLPQTSSSINDGAGRGYSMDDVQTRRLELAVIEKQRIEEENKLAEVQEQVRDATMAVMEMQAKLDDVRRQVHLTLEAHPEVQKNMDLQEQVTTLESTVAELQSQLQVETGELRDTCEMQRSKIQILQDYIKDNLSSGGGAETKNALPEQKAPTGGLSSYYAGSSMFSVTGMFSFGG